MFPNIGPMELMFVLGLGVLLFGKRLPEVGRSLGRGIVEFKKGLGGLTDDLDLTSPPRSSSNYGNSNYGGSSYHHGDTASSTTYTENTVPKFELPGAASSAPTPQMEYHAPQTQD